MWLSPVLSSTGFQGENNKTNYGEQRGLATRGCSSRNGGWLKAGPLGTNSKGRRNQMEAAGEGTEPAVAHVGPAVTRFPYVWVPWHRASPSGQRGGDHGDSKSLVYKKTLLDQSSLP